MHDDSDGKIRVFAHAQYGAHFLPKPGSLIDGKSRTYDSFGLFSWFPALGFSRTRSCHENE